MHLHQVLLSAVALGFAGAAAAQDKPAEERGKYIVEQVAMCGDCHTPAGENGTPDRTRWMKGSVLPFAPLQPVNKWHKTAPDITPAGRTFQKWGDAGMLKFLTTGNGPSGNPADPPMPAYRLSQADAEAVVAYLKSLK